MPTLAIAGGTSASLGRAIVTALLSSQRHNLWNAVILSRNNHIPLWLRAVDQIGVRTQVRAVDYLSVESLAKALKEVHTVVSVTSAIDGTQAQIQKNILHASVQEGCKRFAPSQWAFGPKGEANIESTKWSFAGVWDECLKHKEKIECARFNQGSYMNYIGHGIYPTPSKVDDETALQQITTGNGYMAGEDEACQGLLRQGDLKDGSGAFLIGIRNAIAELPVKNDGSWPPVTMTTMRDVGRFFVASLELPKWEEEMSMVGDTLTIGELLSHAQNASGSKFRVDLVKRADLEKRLQELPPDDFVGRMWAEFKLAYIRDLDDEMVLKPIVNQLCPEVQHMGVLEYMKTFWPLAARDSMVKEGVS
ncbi:hypothetical protein FALBO_13434 [Fusarium albosuccineum]|uniref:NmrA-like domain-containing protein n=1 Tax=Fusarium albosuccineum TaxID=1237068 RepID=A0A8H4L0L4_9HYPO|nr:hypothetical protein FALBO_13434 [Fusarium albosuccineum]